MNQAVLPGATTEWRRHFMLPVAAMFGYSVSVIHIYGIYPYILPVTKEFGWTRGQFTGAFTFAILVQALLAVPVGMLVDRFGSRRLGLAGVVLVCLGFALFSTSSGSLTNWYLMWGIMTLVALPVQATVWTSAVATRFTASRGTAFAITLCGASVAQFVFPPLATRLIGDYGWRTAFVWHGLIWMAVVLPVVFLFFRGARDAGRTAKASPLPRPPAASGVGFRDGLRSPVYVRLLLASLFFTFTIVALNYQFMPILAGWGIEPTRAAWLASLIGLSSVVGRLVTGYLIDRFRASHVGAIVFLLPIIAVLMLLFGEDYAPAPALVAIMLGLTLGAEVDVIVYLTTRFFGLNSFGALYGGLLAALSIGTAIGPLAASLIFDATGRYDRFFWLAIALLLLSSAALFSLPKPADIEEDTSV
ncbi:MULTISPECIES: MFS transporter [Blastomonas]|nr:MULTISPECIES: MFS transporter [Blastomonas]MDK2755216.1 MFS transporter [Blastomonas fulva]MDM7929685.1 MFS transporter [Blastomonas fulva]MDM7965551.1 MFS transporter [Blastomonas fulva]